MLNADPFLQIVLWRPAIDSKLASSDPKYSHPLYNK
jgi:hypothetical protein